MSATGKKGVKRKAQTVEFKVWALEEVEKRLRSKTEICKELQISNSTLSTWIKNSQQIKEGYSSLGPKRKILKTGKWEELETALLQWFTVAREQKHAIITSESLLAKAEEFAKMLNIDNFHGSKGWLSRFRERHSISFKSVCGESNSVNQDSHQMEKWRDTLQSLLEKYKPDDIYNADETGLFFKMLPDKTLDFKSRDCHGTKKSKDRLTVLVCANMTGTDKLPLFVIGKSAKPRCFKNIKTLPTEYANNKSAWMTSEIFENWLRQLDRKMERKRRQIALIIDNCTAHPAIAGLKAVQLIFLPPNTTAKTQPMDQGVIQNLKVHYRKRVVLRQIEAIDNDTVFSLSVLDAMLLVKIAWDCVSPVTISNCFRHAGFQTLAAEIARVENNEDDDELDNIPLSQLAKLTTDCGSLGDYLHFNEDLQTSSVPTDEEIVSAVKDARDANSTNQDIDDGEEEVNTPKPTAEEAMGYVDKLFSYFQGTENSDCELTMLTKLSRKVMREKVFNLVAKRQSVIKDYFPSGECTRL